MIKTMNLNRNMVAKQIFLFMKEIIIGEGLNPISVRDRKS
jgi:hypothetical protein